jgi:hypothetical protein
MLVAFGEFGQGEEDTILLGLAFDPHAKSDKSKVGTERNRG